MKKQLKDICETITKGTTPTTLGYNYQETGINFVKIESINGYGMFEPEKFAHISDDCNIALRRSQLKENDILFSIAGAIGRTAIVNKSILPANTNQALAIIRLNNSEEYNLKFLRYQLASEVVLRQTERQKQGVAQLNLSLKDIGNLELSLPSLSDQQKIATELDTIQSAIDNKKQQLALLDEVVKSEFVEMFGDFSEASNIQWEMKQFTEVAKIDGNMVNDFSKYADYPHIGIDSIEKNTGELKGYRTVKEDNVISGKYLFTSEHIIYSKIRPNLNKVALPTFHGVCSADAYPILVDKTKCNRYYLAYLMRSDYFLTYILAFASRAGMPKVNREQVNGFKLPVPPLDLQNQFAAFVQQIDKSKFIL